MSTVWPAIGLASGEIVDLDYQPSGQLPECSEQATIRGRQRGHYREFPLTVNVLRDSFRVDFGHSRA